MATWKFQVTVVLKAQNQLSVVNGEFVDPGQQNVIDHASWTKVDANAQKIIATSVEDTQLIHIINCATGKAMWDNLHHVYEQKSETAIHILQQRCFKRPRILQMTWPHTLRKLRIWHVN